MANFLGNKSSIVIMDGFDDNFGAPNGAEVDPAADFLAREQDQLGGIVNGLENATIEDSQAGILIFPCIKLPFLNYSPV